MTSLRDAARLHRWLALLAGLVVLLDLAANGSRVAAQSGKDLTEHEREKLKKQAIVLKEQEMLLTRKGNLVEALQVAKQVLEVMITLYPPDEYPQGHPDLVTSLNNVGFLLQSQGEYGKALSFYRQALATSEKLYPPNKYLQGHLHLAQSLNNMGVLLLFQGEYSKALPFCQRALTMRKKLYPSGQYPQGHSDLAASLNNMGSLLQAQGEYGKALPYFQQALAMYQQLYPPDKYPQGHSDLAASLNNMGSLLQTQGEYGKALPFFYEALAIGEKLYPRDKYPQGHPSLASSLNNIGFLHQAQGEFGKALPYYQQALDMRQKLFPRENYPQGHPNLASSLNNVGFLLQAQGEFGTAQLYFLQALAMREKLYPSDKYPQGHPELASSLHFVGNLLQAQGEYGKALPYFQQALTMYQQLYPSDKYPQGHPHLATSLNNMGWLLSLQGEHDKALAYLQQALDMCQKQYPKDKYPQGHPDLASSLHHMGSVLQAQGEYGKALLYYQQALAMYQQLYPSDKHPQGHPHLARSLNNMGHLLNLQGDYGKARASIQQALAMREKLYPPDKYPQGHPELAGSHINMGAQLRLQGEHGKALPYFQQGLAIYQRLYPPDKYPQGHPELATSLNNMGWLLHLQGEYAKALPFYEQALAMREKLYPPDKYPHGHPDLATSLHNIGHLLDLQGESGKALAYLQRVLAMYQQLYPQGHPELARCLNNMGFLFHSQGESGKALAYLQHALSMREKLYPQEKYPQGHPDLVQALDNLSSLHAFQGDYPQSLTIAEKARTMRQGLIELFAAGASETEALNFMNCQQGDADVVLWVSRYLDQPAEKVYAHLWRSKGAITQLLQRRQESLRASATATTQKLAAELQETRWTLACLLMAPADGKANTQQRIRDLTDGKEELERQLAEHLPVFKRHQELDKLSPNALVKLLPAKTAFIDLYRYDEMTQDPKNPRRAGRTLTPRYVAFVLAPGQPIQRIELGLAKDIEIALNDWLLAILPRASGGNGAGGDEFAARVGTLVWEPIRKHLPAETRLVWIAPTADLTRLPWPALPGGKPDTVLLQDHALVSVMHGPFLLDRLTPRAKPLPRSDRMLVVGGVPYDGTPGAVQQPKFIGDAVALRAPVLEAKLWSALTGTGPESEQVQRLAEAGPKFTVIRRTGEQASTAQMQIDLPQVRMAHLATHGFFADKRFRSILQLDEEYFKRTGRDRAAPGSRSPMVLSGVVFAGANRQPGDPDRGILTAEAIASLNLDGLELAVLSACETGLGEVAGGEGVFGLQRAFHLGGTRTVVASLWKVPDDDTQELMSRFYANLWQKKMGPAAALREAQLSLLGVGDDTTRGALRPDRLPTNLKTARPVPWRWAAWVLSGDPGDLSALSTVEPPPSTSPAEVPQTSGTWWYLAGSGLLAVLLAGWAWNRRRLAARRTP